MQHDTEELPSDHGPCPSQLLTSTPVSRDATKRVNFNCSAMATHRIRLARGCVEVKSLVTRTACGETPRKRRSGAGPEDLAKVPKDHRHDDDDRDLSSGGDSVWWPSPL